MLASSRWGLQGSLRTALTGQVTILVLRGGNEGLVPGEHGKEIAAVTRGKERVLEVDIKTAQGALHTECLAKPVWSIVVPFFF
jgi:hypothetical protein